MDEAGTPTAAQRRAPRWRSRWLLPGVPAAVLAILTINVLASGPLVRMDQRVWSAVRSWSQSPAWHWVGGSKFAPAQLVVDLADPHVAIPVLLLVTLAIGARRRSLRPLLTAAVAVILLVATVIPAKILIGRLAPGQLRMQPGDWGAFPSGHTTTATVCYVLAALLLVPQLPAAGRRALLAALPVWCLLVGAALVWRNYHWVTDVVAGWALAAIVLQATVWLTCRAGRPAGTGPRTSAGREDAVPGGRPAARTPG
jgi:membrane-associated phospholipid phosphatase